MADERAAEPKEAVEFGYRVECRFCGRVLAQARGEPGTVELRVRCPRCRSWNVIRGVAGFMVTSG